MKNIMFGAKFIRKNFPVIFSFFVIMFYFTLRAVINSAIAPKTLSDSLILKNEEIIRFLNTIVGMLCTLLVVFIFKYEYIYKTKNCIKTIKCCYGYIFYIIIPIVNSIITSLSYGTEFKDGVYVFFGFVHLFAIGFNEETIFRGIVANSIAQKYGKNKFGVYLSVILSGIIFGATHILNFATGANLLPVIYQVAIACSIGMFFTAIYFRGGNIWVLIILHSLTDTPAFFNKLFLKNYNISSLDVINNQSVYGLIFIPIFILSTYIILRRNKIQIAIDNIYEINNM